MAVRIRLMRMGKIRNPQYRIVIADSRKKRDGRAIEEIGLYHPKEDPSRIEVNSERAQYWLSVGAQPSEPVQRLLELTGDWQKYKGLPAPPPMKTAAPKADKHALYEAEAKAVAATEEKTEKKKPAKKAAKTARAEKSDAKAEKPAKADEKAEKPAKADEKAEKPAKADEKAEKPAKAEEKAEKPAKKAAKAESKPAETEESAGAEAGSES